MKHSLFCKIPTLAVAVLLCAMSAFAQNGADAFNRQGLGTTWVTTAGSLTITNHQMAGSSWIARLLKGCEQSQGRFRRSVPN